jgi:uncharacterized protein (TIGR02145 family)
MSIPTQDVVTIGVQTWTTRNLDVGVFRNGDSIPHAATDEEWQRAAQSKTPAWCYYDNDPKNASRFGRLYNWFAVMDPRGLAPNGFHVPTDAEWQILIDTLGGDEDAGGALKNQTGWDGGATERNSAGFYANPGGSRHYEGGFNYFGSFGNWWSTSERDSTFAWVRNMSMDDNDVNRYFLHKTKGFSVRVLKD